MKKSSVTIVTDEAYCYTDKSGGTKHVYYGTYPSHHGDVNICRVTSPYTHVIGEIVNAYVMWSPKAKIAVNVDLEDD